MRVFGFISERGGEKRSEDFLDLFAVSSGICLGVFLYSSSSSTTQLSNQKKCMEQR